MTEAEWNACNTPKPMLKSLRGNISVRKLRLFAVACCRRIWHLLPDERSRRAVDWSEEFADGLANHPGLAAVSAEAHTACGPTPHPLINISFMLARVTFTGKVGQMGECAVAALMRGDFFSPWSDIPFMASAAVAEAAPGFCGWWKGLTASEAARNREDEAQACLLRCIVGPRFFRPVSVDPAWLKSPLPQLAESIYADRAFDHLPILADALEEAGCTDTDILKHCRQPGEHVRGCWVVDLLLGKE